MDKKIAGIYLDHQHAIVVSNHDGHNVQEFELKGKIKGKHNKSHGSEHAANNSSKTDQVKFFKEITNHLTNSQELYITGHGTAQEQLKHYLQETPQYKNVKIQLGETDQMNEQQLVNKMKKKYHE